MATIRGMEQNTQITADEALLHAFELNDAHDLIIAHMRRDTVAHHGEILSVSEGMRICGPFGNSVRETVRGLIAMGVEDPDTLVNFARTSFSIKATESAPPEANGSEKK